MTTRLTDEVLTNVHSDLRKCYELHPISNQLMAEILNHMDKITVDGYDADAAAAALFTFAASLGTLRFGVREDARPEEIARELVIHIGTMATLAGQALHAQTHATAEEPGPTAQTNIMSEIVEAGLALAAQWPPDRRKTIPAAVVGSIPRPDQLEALRQYRAARGLPGLVNVLRLTAAEMNQAVTWWNHRAAMLRMENP